jgi:hypothetical protein
MPVESTRPEITILPSLDVFKILAGSEGYRNVVILETVGKDDRKVDSAILKRVLKLFAKTHKLGLKEFPVKDLLEHALAGHIDIMNAILDKWSYEGQRFTIGSPLDVVLLYIEQTMEKDLPVDDKIVKLLMDETEDQFTSSDMVVSFGKNEELDNTLFTLYNKSKVPKRYTKIKFLE